MKGLDKFVEFFSDYKECYCIIGGTALHLILENYHVSSRVTHDIDLVILLEVNPEKMIKQVI